jgi:Tfp pilus assembly protein FimT
VCCESGWSLVELIVVAGILALMTVVATPYILTLARRNSVRSAAAEIQTTLLAARLRAVQRNTRATVVVVPAAPPGTDAHALQTVVPDPPSPTPTPVPLSSLPISAVDVAFITLPAGGKISFDGNGRRVVPGGGASADIVVEGPVSSSVRNQITIRTSTTGRVEVVTPTVWQ